MLGFYSFNIYLLFSTGKMFSLFLPNFVIKQFFGVRNYTEGLKIHSYLKEKISCLRPLAALIRVNVYRTACF